jgi:hypothetical protein
MRKMILSLAACVAAMPTPSFASLITYTIAARFDLGVSQVGPYGGEVVDALGLRSYPANTFSMVAILDTSKKTTATGSFILDSLVLTVNGSKTVDFGQNGRFYVYNSLGEGLGFSASDEFDTAPSLPGLESRGFSLSFYGLPTGTVSRSDFLTVDPVTQSAQVNASYYSAANGGAIPSHSNASVSGSSNSPNFLISSSVIVSEVPEPAGWALMFAGFGAVGGMMRRRSRVPALVDCH